LLLPSGNLDRRRHWRKAFLDDRQLDGAWDHVDSHFAATVGHVRPAGHDNLGADHRRTTGGDRARHG
jgi:hypothetical protein